MDQRLGSSSDDQLKIPVPGGFSLTGEGRRQIDRSAEIAGWGTDLEPQVRPGVPRDKAPYLGIESLYPDIEPQTPPHRIHKSTEHAKLTPVFGTSCPPRGLSGKLRDVAYRWSEGRLARWMTLMMADRVDMVEGVVSDFARGRPPNLAREMGWRTEWRYNRKRVITGAAVTAVSLAAIYLLMRARRRR